MFVISIDPANLTGWATSHGLHGVESIAPRKPKPPTKRNPLGVAGEPDDARFVKLWSLLDRLAARAGAEPIVLVHEGPVAHHASARAAQLAFGTWAALCLWAFTRGARRIEVTPLDLQRFVLGRKATPKTYEVMIAAKERLGYLGNDDNEADAMWLLKLEEHQRARAAA